MTLTILAGFRRRWKKLIERARMLGRARRLVRTRQELTLESLERVVQGELKHSKKPPLFPVSRYVFFGERATRPWVTNALVQDDHDRGEKHWGRSCGPTMFLSLRAMYGSAVLANFALALIITTNQKHLSLLLVFLCAVWALSGFFSGCIAIDRWDHSRSAWNRCKKEIVKVPATGVQSTSVDSMSAAMLRRVERVLFGMKQELVGDGSVHAHNVARVREHQRRLGELKVRLEKRIHEGGGGPITHLSNADGTSDVEAPHAPEHLQIVLEGVVRHLETAADALARLDDFQARVDALFTEAEELLREPVRRYDDLALIREIEAEGVALEETAASVRRDIDEALVVLEERITDIRSQVTDSAELIGDIVAALPDIDRSGERNVGEELEHIVSGLMTDTRTRQLA